MPSSKKLSTGNEIDTAKCPLCGKPNQCAVAADPAAIVCWCESVEFPRELLNQIPEKAVRKTCICKNCLDNYSDSTKTTP